MNPIPNQPSSRRFYEWFLPLKRDTGYWGFTLNRITALGLTLYLFLHLIILGQLALGPEAYDNFLAIIHNPIFVFGEWLVVVAGVYHGLNGIRIVLNSLGIALPYQKTLLYTLTAITAIVSLAFAFRMFSAG